MSDALEVGERFFRAIEAGDIDTVREIYHPDVVVWHNTSGLENQQRGQNREENTALLRALGSKVSDWKYDIWFREATESGMVQMHVFRCKLPNGEAVAVPVCIVLHIQNG